MSGVAERPFSRTDYANSLVFRTVCELRCAIYAAQYAHGPHDTQGYVSTRESTASHRVIQNLQTAHSLLMDCLPNHGAVLGEVPLLNPEPEQASARVPESVPMAELSASDLTTPDRPPSQGYSKRQRENGESPPPPPPPPLR